MNNKQSTTVQQPVNEIPFNDLNQLCFDLNGRTGKFAILSYDDETIEDPTLLKKLDCSKFDLLTLSINGQFSKMFLSSKSVDEYLPTLKKEFSIHGSFKGVLQFTKEEIQVKYIRDGKSKILPFHQFDKMNFSEIEINGINYYFIHDFDESVTVEDDGFLEYLKMNEIDCTQ
jgi:hypothetical protein